MRPAAHAAIRPQSLCRETCRAQSGTSCYKSWTETTRSETEKLEGWVLGSSSEEHMGGFQITTGSKGGKPHNPGSCY